MRRSACVLACLAFVLGIQVAAPAHADTQGKLEKAKQEREALQRRLNTAVTRFEQAESQLATTQESLAVVQLRLSEAEDRLKTIQGTLTSRANVAYRQSGGGFLAVLLDSDELGEFMRRLVLLERAATSDSEALIKAASARADIAEYREDLASRRAQERRILDQREELALELGQRFRSASELEARLVKEHAAELERRRREAAERAARAARVARASTAAIASFDPGAFRCPVDGPNAFRDSWGEPRSGGRRHQGVDVFAAQGTPVAAVVDGTILRMMSSSLGGISLYLRGRDGSEYFYAHLAGYAGVAQGQSVAAGTHVAYVGNSGNARGGPAHLHFEIHPGGGRAINPFPTVRAACG